MKSDTKFWARPLHLVPTLITALMATAHASAPAPATAKPDIAKGAAVAAGVCAACHGADGNSSIADNPVLAGQHSAYLMKQLHNFKVREGAKKAERENAIMAGFAAGLSEDDVRNVAAYFSSQKPVGSYAQRKELLADGQRIFRAGVPERGIPACVGCHSPNGGGIPAEFPRLSGQHAQYTRAQLAAFRSGERANSVQMMKISAGLKDKEIEALAEYIAGLR